MQLLHNSHKINDHGLCKNGALTFLTTLSFDLGLGSVYNHPVAKLFPPSPPAKATFSF